MAKKFIFSLTVLSLTIFTALGFAANYYIPDSVNLVAGRTQNICFNIPLKANISNEENIIVSGQEPDPVKDNIKIDLSATTEVLPFKEGSTTAEISAFGIPLKKVSVNIIPQRKVIPCGTIIGVVMKTEGILVLGTGGIKDETGSVMRPADGKIKSGDIILSCNGKEISEKEELIECIKNTNGQVINLEIKREDSNLNVNITPVLNETGEYKIGAWVRDSTQGLGTVTYIDEMKMSYGALGHGVYDVDTRTIIPVSEGVATLSEISGIKKGLSGEPGEVCGILNKNNVIGTVDKNTEQGIYGSINKDGLKKFGNSEPLEIAMMQEVREGSAYILSDILGGKVEKYSVNIESINRFTGTDKGMVVKVTDERLLNETGGIIQGMSGSPIIQNGKLIGAVTHVFVKDATKGYGIFIENMLTAAEAS